MRFFVRLFSILRVWAVCCRETALRLTDLQFLRTALIEGEESGDAGELHMESIRLEAKKEASLD